jgi:hypothetical protein
MNMSLNQLNDSGMIILVGSIKTINTGQILSQATTTPTTLAYIWLSDLQDNPYRPSDLAAKINRLGLIVDSTLSNTIIQLSGRRDNDRWLYYVYQPQPLKVLNLSTQAIQIQTVASPIKSNLNYTFPQGYAQGLVLGQEGVDFHTRTTDIVSVVQTIQAGNSARISSAFSSMPLTLLYVWSGSATRMGTQPDYTVLFQPIDTELIRDFPKNLQGTWNQTNRSISISEIMDDINSPAPSPTDKLLIGSTCITHSECSSNSCQTGVCVAANVGQSCMIASDCLSQNCNMGICEPGAVGTGCTAPIDCTSGNCSGGTCVAVGVGNSCITNQDCTSGACSLTGSTKNFCIPVGNNHLCTISSDCFSNNCVRGLCRQRGNTGDDSNEVKFQWWGWFITVIIIAIVIIVVVVIMQRNTRRQV